MKRADNKSDCPINLAVEAVGDSWSLLVIRDIAANGKKTFGEFLGSQERIGPSVLSDRIGHLERRGLIAKVVDAQDRRRIIYSLGPAGIQLIPLLYELARWGVATTPGAADDPENPWAAVMKCDRDAVVAAWLQAVRAGHSFFIGPHSAAAKLGLTYF